MAGGRSSRSRSKATSTTAKRSLESTQNNAETRKGRPSSLPVKEKKLKLQEERKEQRDSADNSGEGEVLGDSQAYVPPFSRTARRLTEIQRVERTEAKGKNKRKTRGKKSQQRCVDIDLYKKSTQEKTGRGGTVSCESDECKESLSFLEIRNVNELLVNEQARRESTEPKCKDSTTNLVLITEENIKAEVEECMKRILEMLVWKQCKDSTESKMAVESAHQGLNPHEITDEIKPTSGEMEEVKVKDSLPVDEDVNMEISSVEEETYGKQTLEHTACAGMGDTLVRSDVVTDDPIPDAVQPDSVANRGLVSLEVTSGRILDMDVEETVVPGKDTENIAAEVAIIELSSAEELAVAPAHKEAESEEGFVEEQDLVGKHGDNTYNNTSNDCNNNSNSNNDNNNNNNDSRKSKSKSKSKSKRNNDNNKNSNDIQADNKVFPCETDLENGTVQTEQTFNGGNNSTDFDLDMMAKIVALVVDQQVPVSVFSNQDKEETNKEHTTSMLVEKETSMLSQQTSKDSTGTLADMVSFEPTESSLGNSEGQAEQDQREDSPHEMMTRLETTGTKESAREHTVLSELNSKENEQIERCQETGFSEKLQNNGREKCLPGNDFKDVTPKEGLPQNELKQGSGVVLIHSISTSIPLQDAALQSIDGSATVEEYQETDGVTNEVETNTAMAEDQKQKGGDFSEKDKVSEKDDSSSGQPENTDNDRSSSGVAHQMKKETSIINAEKAVNVDFLLDVDCVMDCTDSQLVHLGEDSLEATMDTSEQMAQVPICAEFNEASGSRDVPSCTENVPTTAQDDGIASGDMIKGLTRELSALNQYLMGAWKEVEAVRKQRQARLKANKSKRAKQ